MWSGLDRPDGANQSEFAQSDAMPEACQLGHTRCKEAHCRAKRDRGDQADSEKEARPKAQAKTQARPKETTQAGTQKGAQAKAQKGACPSPQEDAKAEARFDIQEGCGTL